MHIRLTKGSFYHQCVCWIHKNTSDDTSLHLLYLFIIPVFKTREEEEE